MKKNYLELFIFTCLASSLHAEDRASWTVTAGEDSSRAVKPSSWATKLRQGPIDQYWPTLSSPSEAEVRSTVPKARKRPAPLFLPQDKSTPSPAVLANPLSDRVKRQEMYTKKFLILKKQEKILAIIAACEERLVNFEVPGQENLKMQIQYLRVAQESIYGSRIELLNQQQFSCEDTQKILMEDDNFDEGLVEGANELLAEIEAARC